jgi:hypothetical protein
MTKIDRCREVIDLIKYEWKNLVSMLTQALPACESTLCQSEEVSAQQKTRGKHHAFFEINRFLRRLVFRF